MLSVITINYNGLKYAKDLLDSLRSQTYKDLEIIIVDNGSTDGSIDFIKQNYPEVKLIETGQNLGFTGGNNVGLREAKGDILVLLNNDTRIEPEWAEEIVKAFEDPEVGITTSKLTFFYQFLPIELRTQTICLRDMGLEKDPRDRGAKVYNISFSNTDYKKKFVRHGFYENQTDKEGNEYNWIAEKSEIYLPISLKEGSNNLIIEVEGNGFVHDQELEIIIGKEHVCKINVKAGQRTQHTVKIDPSIIKKYSQYIINNAGTYIHTLNGWTQDLGIDEWDEGQYEKEKEVNGACGCSLAISRKAFENIGFMDESYFMYFEDTDYSWRAINNGWKIKYLPKSVVRHIHSGSTSKRGQYFFKYYVQRNRLLCLAKNGSIKNSIKEVIKFKLHTLKLLLLTAKSVIFKYRRPLLAERSEQLAINIKILFFLAFNLPFIYLKKVFK